MKKFTQWVDVIREAEERQQSELQKSYKEYFSAKLNKFGAKSPADLDAEQKAEFFNEIKKDWEKGTGAKPAGKKDVEEHGVKESEEFDLSEGVFYRLPRKTIENELWLVTKNMQNLFNYASAGSDTDPGVLDSIIKSLEKIKKQYKKFSSKEEVSGTVYESEEVNESAIEIAGGIILGIVGLKVIGGIAKGLFGTLKLKAMKDPAKLKELASQIASKAMEKNPLKAALWLGAVKEMIDSGDIKDGFGLLKTAAKMDSIDIKKVFESEGFDFSSDVNESEEFEINEAVATPEELASFIQKEEKHFAAFLKPKKLTATVSGKVVTIKPGSGSFTITVDYAKSTIDTTGKPAWPESTSYVELMEYIKITKFKLNESEDVNEARSKTELEDSLKTLEDKLRKYKGVRQNSIHPFDPQKKVSDYVAYLETSIKYVKAEIAGVNESNIFEAEIKNASDFKEYATTVLKKQHGDKYDEKVADKVIKGLSDEAEKSGDWGAAVGKLNA